MHVKLYKLDASPPARAAMMGCEVFNVPVEMIDVNLLAGEHRKPEFLKKNPIHSVPVLAVDDFIIHDSHAILTYLADVYGKDDSFYPKDIKKRTEVNQKLYFDATILFPRLRNVTIGLRLMESTGDSRSGSFLVQRLAIAIQRGNTASVMGTFAPGTYPLLIEGIPSKGPNEKQRKDIEEAYEILENFLSQSKFIAGDNITIADISSFAAVTSLVHLLALNKTKFPKIQAWIEVMEKQPYSKKYNAPGAEILGKLYKAKLST